jgi:oxalate decarboxylase
LGDGSKSLTNTVLFKANDVGFVPAVCGHYIQNTGNDDMEVLAIFKSPEFVEFSLNQWLRRLPVQVTEAETNLNATAIARIPDMRNNIIPASSPSGTDPR